MRYANGVRIVAKHASNSATLAMLDNALTEIDYLFQLVSDHESGIANLSRTLSRIVAENEELRTSLEECVSALSPEHHKTAERARAVLRALARDAG